MTFVSSKTSRKAFTLIELLVVIAIISLLVSILLPSLQMAKKMAHDAVCKSNQRSLSLWMGMYLNDNSEKFVPHYTYPEMPLFWWSKLHLYYENDTSGSYDDKVYLSYSQNVSKVFSCPAAECPSYGWGANDWLTTKDVSYGLQHDYIVDASYSDIAHTSDTLLIADIETRPAGFWIIYSPQWRLMDGTDYYSNWGGASWHNGGLNILWADLHVSGMQEKALYDDGNDTYFDFQ